jgi:hypothetical protein
MILLRSTAPCRYLGRLLRKRLSPDHAGVNGLQLARDEPPLLVVAHPGHELRLFGWLCDARPDVMVLTDGSGHSRRSRIEATDRVLRAAGARAGPVFGDYTDRELYAALLAGDASPFVKMAAAVVNVLRRGQYRAVIADPLEGYNPTHDLCRVIVNCAVNHVNREGGNAIRNYEYALSGASNMRGFPASIVIRIPAQIRVRKIAAATGYRELLGEVEAAVQREGKRAYDEEVLHEIAAARLGDTPLAIPPFYETYGAQQCRAGRYTSVIRYAEHFVPMARAIAESIDSTAELAAVAGARLTA